MELNLLNLLLVLLAAWGGGLAANRLGYPSVLGELLVGILLGPPLLGLLTTGPVLGALAEVGLLLMMLYIGMEIDPRELGKASRGGLLAAAGGFLVPFAACYAVMASAGFGPTAALFVGIAAGVTSLATKSRVLLDLRLLHTRVAHVMLAGALVTDVASLVLFGAILGVANVGAVEPAALTLLLVKAVAFFGLATWVGLRVLPALGRQLQRLKAYGPTAAFTLVLLVTFAYAEAAELAGLHGILGAFLAGLFLRENHLGRTLSRQLMDAVSHASLGFLAPLFFVTAGFAVSLDVFRTDLGLLAALVGVATLAKVLGTLLFYLPSGNGWREGLVIGLGMNGRGAVEIIVAQLALELDLISAEVFSILVFMAILTSALEPVLLKQGIAWLRRRGELAEADVGREGVLVVGAGAAARRLARILADAAVGPVALVDANAEHVRQARREGLAAVHGNALDERVLAEAGAGEARHLVAMTSNGEVNGLAAQLGQRVFAIPHAHVLRGAADPATHAALSAHATATTLFGGPVTLGEWTYLLGRDRAAEEVLAVTAPEASEDFFRRLQREGSVLPLVVRRGPAAEPFHSGLALERGDAVVVLRAAPAAAEAAPDRVDALVAAAPVLDLAGPLALPDFVKAAARVLAPVADLGAGAFMERMMSREAESSTVILPGLAIPHLRVAGQGVSALLVARCREGIAFPGAEEPVVAAFALVTSEDQRNVHLRLLAAVAQAAQQPDFERRWLQAPDPEALRALLLRPDRSVPTRSSTHRTP